MALLIFRALKAFDISHLSDWRFGKDISRASLNV